MPERLTHTQEDFSAFNNSNGSTIRPYVIKSGETNSSINESSLTYNVRLDFQAYQDLDKQKGWLSEPEYQLKLKNLTELTKTNVITSIGERLNVELFRTQYRLEEKQLISPLYGEPFLEVVKRGQQFREQKGSRDVKREKAEVEGFKKAQELLADRNLGSDAKIIIISPRGDKNSIYQHNFYDVYEKGQDRNINMYRYTSKHSYTQLWQTVQEVDPFNNIPDSSQDHDFLENPLVTYLSKENIQQLFNPDTKTMSIEEFIRTTNSSQCKNQIQAYFQALASGQDPGTLQHQYNLIAKAADIVSGLDPQSKKINYQEHLNTPLRIVATACGISGSVNNPFSVSEFGNQSFVLKDQFGTLEIRCQECHISYIRTSGKLEENCRFCGGTKGIAC